MFTGNKSGFRLTISLMVICTLLVSRGISYTTERVVLVIIDGLRYSEGLGDVDYEQVPNMAALAEQGALVSNFQNDGITYTSRAIPAIWCGAWTEINTFSDPACDGNTNNTTELPTVFEYYRKQLERPAEDCVYTIKDLCPWKASLDPEYGMDYWPLYHAVGNTDEDVWHETEQVIASLAPHFLLMYLADVDHAGHSGVWEDYLQAIITADSLVGELWTTLQANPDYADKTTLLVTNDHGRHSENFSGHGDDCAGCRHIQLLAVGPDIHPGLISEVPRVIPDIAPTIGELLGFTTEYATGTAMLELIDQTTGTMHENTNISPESFTFKPLYPSPFNASLSIQYEVLNSDPVKLEIFNLQGARIWSKDLTGKGQGEHIVVWDTANFESGPLSSGIFIVQLSNQGKSQSQKILLLK